LKRPRSDGAFGWQQTARPAQPLSACALRPKGGAVGGAPVWGEASPSAGGAGPRGAVGGGAMTATRATAEVLWTAFMSTPARERRAFAERLVADPRLQGRQNDAPRRCRARGRLAAP